MKTNIYVCASDIVSSWHPGVASQRYVYDPSSEYPCHANVAKNVHY